MEQALIQCSYEGRTEIIRIRNPPVNVINGPVRAQLKAALQAAAVDDRVTTVVLTGSGKAFMAGADISGFPDMIGKPYAAYEFVYDAYDPWFLLESMEKPTIAAIDGLALGAGLEMALCCDLRIASAGAKLGLPEIKLGLFPGGGGTQRLSRLIGKAKTKELIYLGEPVSAEEALALGIVNRVAPAGKALSAALALAERINAKSSVALACAKRAVDRGSQLSLREGIEVEAREFQRAFLSEDIREGVAAFLEKREPQFHNR